MLLLRIWTYARSWKIYILMYNMISSFRSKMTTTVKLSLPPPLFLLSRKSPYNIPKNEILCINTLLKTTINFHTHPTNTQKTSKRSKVCGVRWNLHSIISFLPFPASGCKHCMILHFKQIHPRRKLADQAFPWEFEENSNRHIFNVDEKQSNVF